MSELNCSHVKNLGTLAFYYRYEETSGTVVTDYSIQGNNGTASRTNILNNSGGKFGYKAVFGSALSDNISIGTPSIMKPTGAFTIGSWINTGTSTDTQGIVQVDDESANVAGFRFEITSGVIALIMGNNSGVGGTSVQTVTSAGSINNNTWNLIGCTFDGTVAKMWINGTLDGTLAVTSGFSPAYAGTAYARIGCLNFSGANSSFLNGSLDDTFLINGTAIITTDWIQLYSGACDLVGLLGCEI